MIHEGLSHGWIEEQFLTTVLGYSSAAEYIPKVLSVLGQIPSTFQKGENKHNCSNNNNQLKRIITTPPIRIEGQRL
jgi:hypothetical protein